MKVGNTKMWGEEKKNRGGRRVSSRRLRLVDIGLSCSTTSAEEEGDEEEEREAE